MHCDHASVPYESGNPAGTCLLMSVTAAMKPITEAIALEYR
jgi:hypothetical protein